MCRCVCVCVCVFCFGLKKQVIVLLNFRCLFETKLHMIKRIINRAESGKYEEEEEEKKRKDEKHMSKHVRMLCTCSFAFCGNSKTTVRHYEKCTKFLLR